MRGDHEIEKPFLRNEAKSKEGLRATADPARRLALPREIIAGIHPYKDILPNVFFLRNEAK